MRSLKKNESKLWYSLYDKAIPIYEIDESGNIIHIEINGELVPVETGETSAGYLEPVLFFANISSGKGAAQDSVFGKDIQFTRAISSCDMHLPITETSLIWEHEPVLKADGSVDREDADYEVAAPVAKGLNSLMIAVKQMPK